MIFSQIKLYVLAAVFSFIIAAVGAGYLKYKSMLSDIETLQFEKQELQLHNTQLKDSIEEQKHVISELENSMNSVRFIRKKHITGDLFLDKPGVRLVFVE